MSDIKNPENMEFKTITEREGGTDEQPLYRSRIDIPVHKRSLYGSLSLSKKKAEKSVGEELLKFITSPTTSMFHLSSKNLLQEQFKGSTVTYATIREEGPYCSPLYRSVVMIPDKGYVESGVSCSSKIEAEKSAALELLRRLGMEPRQQLHQKQQICSHCEQHLVLHTTKGGHTLWACPNIEFLG